MKVKDETVEVFAVDYGCTLLVNKSEVYDLPEELLPSVCPQNASLCTISGNYKGDNICDFLIAFLHLSPSEKGQL